jgi:hypothetical protein
MNLRLYLLGILLTWGAAFAGFTLIKHGYLVLALMSLLIYWFTVLALAFRLDTEEHLTRFRFIGAFDKTDRPRQEWE